MIAKAATAVGALGDLTEGLSAPWLFRLRRYLAFVAAANLVWEAAHVPLYTIWGEGTPSEIAFAVIHCTGGDLLISVASLVLALLLVGNHAWPARAVGPVAVLTSAFGVSYTVFSEWLNVVVRKSWAYSDLMPVIPVLDAGLSPVAQWIVIPLTAFWWARRPPPQVSPQHRVARMRTPLSYRLALICSALTLIGGWAPAAAQEAATLADLAKRTHFHGLAVDPADASRLYLATHHGFFLVSADGRAERRAETADDFMGFTPHPRDAGVLYASGHPARGGNLGFMVSRDGGRSWQKLSNGADGPVDFHQMDVSKVDPNVIYGNYGGLQASRDGGRTWTKIGPTPEGLIALAASTKDVNTLFAATQTGLLTSSDGGKSWQPAYLLRRPATMVSVTASGEVYAFIYGTGLVRATEPELRWQTVNGNFGKGYILHFAAAAKDPGRLYAIDDGPAVIESRDGGKTWSPLPGQGTSEGHAK